MGQLDSVVINGPVDPAHRYIGNLNLSFAYVEGESLIMGLKVRSLQLLVLAVAGLSGAQSPTCCGSLLRLQPRSRHAEQLDMAVCPNGDLVPCTPSNLNHKALQP